jgi:indole-3-glycerol phosphate synthase
MTSALTRLGAASRARAELEMAQRPLAQLEEIIEHLPPVRPFAARLRRGAGPLPRVIAELKRASPSAGMMRESYSPLLIARGYTRVGAAALSVVTEPSEFGGHLDHVHEVRPAHLPILRKDFLVTPYQIAQSRVAGADAVLLIAALLEGPALGIMAQAARRYGIEALVEVHDEADLARALDQEATMIGVNNRDLATMQVDLATCVKLAPRIPDGIVAVAESGIKQRADIDRMMAAGYAAILVGEALMKAPDPGDALWKMLQPEGS